MSTRAAAVLMAALLCAGCVSIGPPAISNGRMDWSALTKDFSCCASVGIRFKEWRFYIAETDAPSKDSFRLIKLLFSLRLNPEGSSAQVPVLTVPIN